MEKFRAAEQLALRSQFHYGSIQINEIVFYARNGATVSIPLWFDSDKSWGKK